MSATIASVIFVGAWVAFVRRWRRKHPEPSAAGAVVDWVLKKARIGGGDKIKRLEKAVDKVREWCLDEKQVDVDDQDTGGGA